MSFELRRLRCWDGLHYSFQMLRLCHQSLWDICCAIPEDNSQAVHALALTWSFIDSLHRIREISQAIPGLSSKHVEMRIFLDQTKLAEDYRHYIQHLREEINSEPPNSFPVWGSLAWVDKSDPSKFHIAHLGAQIPGMQFSGCVFDTQNLRWASNVCLGISSKSFNFDPIFESAMRFEKFVVPHLIESFSPEVQKHEKLPITSVQFLLKRVDEQDSQDT